MAQPVFTFSVPEHQTKDLKFLRDLKDRCRQTGQSFSFLVIKALKTQEANTNAPT